MKNIIKIIIIILPLLLFCEFPDGNELLRKADENSYSSSIISSSQMVVHGRRTSRTIKLRSWKQGENSFSEYLDPPRERGTKMLKLEDKLWIYEPSSDRTIQISGHMLRQSVMGSDLSYEDMMEETELHNIYSAITVGEETIEGRACWVLELIATNSEVSYETRKIWLDKERMIGLKEELFAKSGKLLKTTIITEVQRVGKRWYPKKILFKDMLKKGKGTELLLDDIELEAEIPKSKFSKAGLRS